MNKSRLDLPHIKLFIANKIAYGCSQREIAKELNTTQPVISRMVKRKDVAYLIGEITDDLLRQVYEAFKRIKNDPRFMVVMQTGLEKNLLNYIKRL
jgi:predicted transcriptional regulator